MIAPAPKRTTDDEFGYLNSKELEDPLLRQDVAKIFRKLAAIVGIPATLGAGTLRSAESTKRHRTRSR